MQTPGLAKAMVLGLEYKRIALVSRGNIIYRVEGKESAQLSPSSYRAIQDAVKLKQAVAKSLKLCNTSNNIYVSCLTMIEVKK